MNYIISQYLVFEKNDQGGILPETRWDRRTRLYNEGRAEAVSNWNRYQEDEKVLTNLNKKLQENGQTITDNAERQKIADKVLKNASERAKDYGNQIVANTKTLSDFKKENEVEDPNKQVKPKFTDGLKSFASSALSSIGNAVISAGTAMIAQQLISWGLQGIDAIVHYDDNIIAKGQEAKESIQSQTKAYEDQKASLGELTSKYTELSKGVKISGNSIKNISLTDDEYKDFLDTSNQIAAAAPSLTRSWDSQGNAILNAGTNAEDLNTQVNDYLKLQRNLTYYDTKKNISDQYKGYETALGKNKGKQDEYKNAYDAAKYKVDSVQKFSDMLKKHTKGEDTITYTLDQTAYDALGNTFGKAIKGYKQSADGQKITLEFDGKQLDFLNSEAASVLNSDNSELQEAHTNLVNTQESIDASKREMVSSIKSMASTIDSFDSWDDQDKASEFQSQLNSMLSSSDGTRLLDNFEQSGKDMDTWLRNNVVNPMATATPDQQKLWSQLFEMEPKDQETVREFAARRDDVLESIADISQSDFWTKGTLAEAFGFAHTEYDDNDKAYTVWENQDSLNRVRDALKGAKASKTKGDAEKVREDLKNATQDELEIAVQVITDNKDLGSIDDFYTAFEKAKQAAKDMSDQAAVSLDSMETKVSTAKSTLSSMGTILTETTSAGGISKDNVKILSTAFKDVKDPRGIEQNVNDLFTTTSDGIKLNIDALKTFTEYQAEATDGDFEKGIKLQTKAIAEQAEETDKAWKAIAKADDKEAARATYNAEKDKLKDARDEYLSYMQSQSEWQATKKQQQELLSYYSQWQRAQSTENAGDKYNNIVAGLKNAKDAYDKGLVGTDDFKSFAALISPTGSDDRANFAENYGKAVRYLTEDKTGVNNFLADLKSKGMASYDDASKRWSFDIDDMSKAARSMGISKEFMSANFGRLRDYGIDNNFISSIEEGIDRTQELTSALSDEQKRLEELKNTDSTNTTAISASEDKVNKYKQDLKETYDNMESYSEDAAQNAIDNFNSSAMGAQAYEEEIKRVQKNDQLTNDQRNAAINQLKAKQEELAASAGTTVEALLGTDVSSLMDGIITDSASVTTALDGINKAYEEQNTDVTSLVDTLGKYTSEQLEGIDFNDGKWDTELGDAEKAVESLCEKLGLTKDQARSVIEALKEAGKLKDSEESSDSSKETTKGSWEKPQTAEQMGFGDDPDRAAEYTHSLEALTAAHKENDAATEKSFETLSKYNRTQLEGIKLNDGAYNVEGIEQAEDAIQQLADKTQLSKDQILTALEGLGVLKVNAPTMDATKGLEDLVSEAKDAQDELSDLTGKTYTFDFDTTDLDTAHKQVADLQEEVNKYRDRDGKFHSEYTGGEQVQSMYKAAIAQEQNAEYSSSAIGQSSLSSDVVQAAQDFMQAKNEMDQQTQLYQNGMDNTLDQATQDANAAFETLQQAQTDSGIKLVDTDNIQTAEDQLLQLSNEDISDKIKIDVDTTSVDDALADVQALAADGKMGSIDLDFDVNTMSIDDIDSKIEELTNQQKVLTILGDVEGADKVQALIDALQQVHDKQVEVVAQTQGADLVDQLQSRIAELQDKNVSIDAIVQDDKVQSLISEIAALPPEVQIAIGVDESNVGNAEAIKAQIESDPASVNVNYTKGDQEPAEDQKADVNYTLGSQDPPNDKTAKVTYTLGYQAPPSDKVAHVTYIGGKASGTMTSIAHASGTAYNVLNMKPLSSAHAKGEVALKHDEQALVNEVGINGHSESIVRDGVWSLIPGGAHIENLKKGDIIFSATQTEDLLKHGATHGHARAYAQGTASGVTLAPAYADGTSELDDTIKKVSTQAKDWIETALDRLERIVEKYQDIAESDYSNYKSSEKNYNKALKNLNKQLQTQKDSRAKYVAKANEVASAVGLSDELKKKVQNGTINIESLSEDDKKRVDAYQEWYEKILDCDKAIRELTKSQKDLAKAKVERVIEAYDTVIGKRENKADYYNAKQELRVSQGYNQKPGSIYEKYMKKELYYTNEQKRLTDKEIKEYKGRMKEYLKVNGHKTVDPEYQKMKKQLYGLQTEAVKLENEAAELVQALQDNREQIKQWAVDRWDRAGSKQDAVIDYAKANDNPEYQINEKIYQERIKSNARQINALQKLRAEKAEYYDTHFSSMNNEEAQKYLNSIAQIDEQILKIGSDIENLKNEIMELRWKPFDDAQDKLSNVITEYQTMQKLLGDAESFYNDDGSFTTNGLTNILLTQESIDATKQKIANYREGLNKLEEQYKNGCYSLDEYNEKSKQLLDGIQQESTALSELKQNMLDMYETQIKKENDLLQENIDKRKNALSAKEKYYDYDKTLKKKSKDINTLKSQIAALEGTSNAAAKARLEKLRAELADAEDDMADTMHQHEVDMKNTGYENFSNEANKALDNTLDAVKKNSSFQEAIISGMLTNVTANYDNTYKHLHTVMDQYGVKVSSTFDTMIGKSADFNTSLIQQIKALETISNMKVTLPYGTSNGQGGSTTGNNTYTGAENGIHNTFNSNKDSTGAGNETPGTVNNKKYSLKLNATDIYLTYDHIKQQLKATWSPSKPEHSDIEWKSSDESIAKVSSDGTVRGVSSGVDKNGLMARDESKTRKCIITAIGGGGLAKATCTVHIMPNAHYEAIKSYAANAGIDVTSGDNLRAAMQYAYQNGANHSYQSDVAVEGFKKAYLKDWTNSLSNRPDGATDVPAGVSPLIGYFNSKGKKVGPKEMQQLADILEISTPGVKKYDSWGSALKNQILQKYKSYGFATGGIINKLIPADMSTLLGKAIISNGDQGFIGAKVGESVMTEEFTRLLKPSIAAMNNFTNMFNPVTPTATNNDYTINNEVNINVANMSNDLDIQDVANKVSTIINKNMTRDWRKLR
jgi:DNA repair exonuclease SbcCD ATPase subunit|nr:MAG TPA: endonuclease subunit [Caudoviricetes sp.]